MSKSIESANEILAKANLVLNIVLAQLENLKVLQNALMAAETPVSAVPATNGEHYKDPDKRTKAWQRFCDSHGSPGCRACEFIRLTGSCREHFSAMTYTGEWDE